MSDFIIKMEEHYSDKYKINYKIRITQKGYDAFIYLFNFLTFRKSFKVISDLCKKYSVSHKNVLDIGSFTGYNSFYFKCMRNNVTGIDLSKKINYAKKRYGIYKIEFIQADIYEYISPVFIKKFDFIFCSNLPIHYDTGTFLESKFVRKFFTNIYEFMKTDAVFYYIFYSTKHEKVGFPVSSSEIITVMNELNIPYYNISEKTIYDYPMIELIIIKESMTLKSGTYTLRPLTKNDLPRILPK